MTGEAKPAAKKKIFFLRKKFIACVIFLLAMVAGGICGIFMHKYKIFPYNKLKSAYDNIPKRKVYGPWSIGIYEGNTPFDLVPYPGVKNPVLTGRECGDAVFVADPFMIIRDNKYFIFFELLDRASNEGKIAYAESADLKNWEYKKVVIDENFHMSFPTVFKWKGEYYLVPESHENLSVRLYKAESFPDKWKFVKKLISGYSFVDPAIFHYNNKWWMFVTTKFSNILNIYYADDLMGKWEPHPMNPVVRFNAHISRPGGRVIIYKGKPYRFTQDCEPYYGMQVFAFEITELTETKYSERMVSPKPILTKSGEGWNAEGMHHVDPHKVGNKWIAVADGRDREGDD